jgi:hypothetical protein
MPCFISLDVAYRTIFKDLKGFVRQNSHSEGSMGEGYLMQEAMGVCHDVIGDVDKYAPRAWKEEKDERKTSMYIHLAT